ncbi:MAG: Rne/Rng family ribonuclease [Cyanobacteria bacterium]|nr:Rne/Rng family ribonuclease [Cyanobacteria bacterium bin.51]
MPQQIVIAEQLRIAAVLNDERVDELVVAQGRYQIGDVYLGRVENVLPGIDAAFVNIGESEKNGFIHVTDLGPLRLRKGAAGITELLEPRQKVLVQVMKEPTGTKGPRLTGNLTLPGRYLVLQPHGQGVSISRRINGENERNRLRALGVLIKPPGAGLLVRTEAEGISEDLLIDDLETLLRQWEGIQEAAEIASPPVLLNRDEDFIHRVLRDLYSPEVLRVVVDTPAAVARVNAFLGADQASLQVEHHAETSDILEHYRVNAAIRDSLKPRADLPSGGYVIIEPTEALTVIDVNSGSFTRSANARETVLWTNCEAAAEIARQLKLRNIGGVVIIDFIDMESRRDQLMLLEHFTQAVRDDTARPQIAQLSELGLVELTRKRQGQNIYELFGRACPSCGGLGHVAVLPGTDSLQPLATVSGLVRSAASARAEVVSPATTESNGRRRGGRGSRGGRSSEPVEAPVSAPVQATASSSEPSEAAAGFVSEPVSRRQEPELVAVPMEEEQELVYGWLGLNPTLLLDPQPSGEHLMVRVVRPGEDSEAVLEAARQQQSSTASRRRRRGGRGNGDNSSTDGSTRDNGSGDNGASGGASSQAGSSAGSTLVRREPAPEVLVEITPLPLESEEPMATVATVIEAPVVQVPLSRKITRSRPSAVASVAPETSALPANGSASQGIPLAETTAEAPAQPASDEQDAGEPRRRRRRSSAAV